MFVHKAYPALSWSHFYRTRAAGARAGGRAGRAVPGRREHGRGRRAERIPAVAALAGAAPRCRARPGVHCCAICAHRGRPACRARPAAAAAAAAAAGRGQAWRWRLASTLAAGTGRQWRRLWPLNRRGPAWPRTGQATSGPDCAGQAAPGPDRAEGAGGYERRAQAAARTAWPCWQARQLAPGWARGLRSCRRVAEAALGWRVPVRGRDCGRAGALRATSVLTFSVSFWLALRLLNLPRCKCRCSFVIRS